jgi:hypothetical protein
MMLKRLVLTGALLFAATSAQAHTPLCSCFDNGDNTITCEGGFSDGSSAAGVGVSVMGNDGKVVLEGKMDANSEFTFDKPAGDFQVLFDAGEGHKITVSGKDIVQ